MKNKSGMTLVEMVIAIGLLGIISVSIFPSLVVLSKMNYVSKENLSSNYIAQDVSERLYNYSQTIAEDDLVNTLINNQGYSLSSNTGNSYFLSKDEEDFKIDLEINLSDASTHFVKVNVSVSSLNEAIDNKSSQIESILRFGN